MNDLEAEIRGRSHLLTLEEGMGISFSFAKVAHRESLVDVQIEVASP